MALLQQLLGAGQAADLPASQPPAAVAASRGRGRRGGSSRRQERGSSGCGRRAGAVVPIPRPLDPPRQGTQADALPLPGDLSPQVGDLFAFAQILPVGEGLAADQRRQIVRSATPDHLGHGAAVLVDGLGAKRHHRTNRGQLLQALPGCGAVGALSGLGGIMQAKRIVSRLLPSFMLSSIIEAFTKASLFRSLLPWISLIISRLSQAGLNKLAIV